MYQYTIRLSTEKDISCLLDIFEQAKSIMRSNGNLNQWLGTYPSIELIKDDIKNGHSFVCEDSDGKIIATFAFIIGTDSTYHNIYNGDWLNNDIPYGVIHRIASTKESHNVAYNCFNWCSEQIDNLRIDTHRDNTIMQHILVKYGFKYCGIIYLENGDERLAYHWIKTNNK